METRNYFKRSTAILLILAVFFTLVNFQLFAVPAAATPSLPQITIHTNYCDDCAHLDGDCANYDNGNGTCPDAVLGRHSAQYGASYVTTTQLHTFAVTTNGFAKEGFALSTLWSYDRQGSNTFFTRPSANPHTANTNTTATADVDIYAIWVPLRTITLNSGTVAPADITPTNETTDVPRIFSLEDITKAIKPATPSEKYEGQVINMTAITALSHEHSSPQSPRAPGRQFTGWYPTPELALESATVLSTNSTWFTNNRFNLATLITGDMTLYAGWRGLVTVELDLNYDNFPLGTATVQGVEYKEARITTISNFPPTTNPDKIPPFKNAYAPFTSIQSAAPTIPIAPVEGGVVLPGSPTVRSGFGYRFVEWVWNPEDNGVWDEDKIVPFPLTTPLDPDIHDNIILMARWAPVITYDFNLNWPSTITDTPPAPPVPQYGRTTVTGLNMHTIPATDLSTTHVVPNQKPCPFYDTLCANASVCTDTAPANALRHGYEYSFVGWFRNPAGTGERVHTATLVTEADMEQFAANNTSIPLYAKWELSKKANFVINPQSFDLQFNAFTELPANSPQVTNILNNPPAPFRYITVPPPSLTATPASMTVSFDNGNNQPLSSNHIRDGAGWFVGPDATITGTRQFSFGTFNPTETFVEANRRANSFQYPADTDEITLYMKWIPAYAIRFIRNQPTASPDTQAFRYFVPRTGGTIAQMWTNANLSATAPSWPGANTDAFYRRGGDNAVNTWYTNPEGTSAVYNNAANITSDITLYASWINKVRVEFWCPDDYRLFVSPPLLL
ncbi:MAG: InlB B-repeat-containing protein, partial [Oscillospiraceae bacterium]|nr:InlB B-repeat-containing protein [Oscillospiraceae bacterium]